MKGLIRCVRVNENGLIQCVRVNGNGLSQCVRVNENGLSQCGKREAKCAISDAITIKGTFELR